MNQSLPTKPEAVVPDMAKYNDREDETDIAALIALFWRGRWIIAAAMFVAVIIGAYYSFVVATPIYSSTAVVILETREESIVDLESVVSGLSGDTSTVNSEVEVLKSRTLLGKVVDRLDLTRDPEFNGALRDPTFTARLKSRVRALLGYLPGLDTTTGGTASSGPVDEAERARNGAINALLNKLSIRNLPQTVVFQVTIRSEDPQKAALIADTLVEMYILNQLEVKFEATEQATTWLTERVTELQQQLEAAEAEVKAFSASTDLVSPETLSALENQLKDIRDRSESTRGLKEAAEARLARLQAADTRAAQAAAAEDTQLTQLLQRIDTPAIAEAFDARFQQIVARTELDVTRAAAQLPALERSQVELESRISKQGEDLITLQQLTREAEANRLLYEYFLGRLKETSAQKGIQQADSRILSHAVVPNVPSAPRKSMLLAMSGMVGMMIGVGLVLLREARQNGFRTSRDLERITGRTVMGQIPLLPARRRKDAIAYLNQRPTSAAAEAIRNLRTSLLLSNVDHPPKVIAITSSIPGEGKTTMSLALAQNFVGMDRKVLLVEGDIRRRVFSQYLNTDQTKGLLSVLSGESKLDEVVVRDPIVGADVLLGEKSSTSAVDIFSSERFSQLMEKARDAYDVILIDTPPVLVVPDARVIAQSADALLFVVKWDSTTKSQVEDALHMFDTANQRVHGLALNQISVKGMKRYGYGGKYGAYSSYGRKYYTN